jgi:hypothetical protein
MRRRAFDVAELLHAEFVVPELSAAWFVPGRAQQIGGWRVDEFG